MIKGRGQVLRTFTIVLNLKLWAPKMGERSEVLETWIQGKTDFESVPVSISFSQIWKVFHSEVEYRGTWLANQNATIGFSQIMSVKQTSQNWNELSVLIKKNGLRTDQTVFKKVLLRQFKNAFVPLNLCHKWGGTFHESAFYFIVTIFCFFGYFWLICIFGILWHT